MVIDIDFEVFKALTSLRRSEDHTCNDVIRELVGLETDGNSGSPNPLGGRMLGGRFLANGTRLRAKYKDIFYRAEISGGELIYDETTHRSASAAARTITGNNVNGLTFWEVKRPEDASWTKLVALPRNR